MAEPRTRIAITGSHGWIGGAFVRLIGDEGSGEFDVVPIHHATTDDAAALAAVESADIVIHAGGVASYDRVKVVEGMVAQGALLARGLARTNNTVVFLSSIKVYGWARTTDQVCTEEDPVTPSEPFGSAKMVVEDTMRLAALRSICLRISNVYASDCPAKYAFGTMLDTVRREGRMILDCTGESERDFVHLADVLGVLQRIVAWARQEGRPAAPSHRIFNVASGQSVSMMSMARVFERELGATIETRNGRVISSPRFANRAVRDAGFADAFVAPLAGARAILQESRRSR